MCRLAAHVAERQELEHEQDEEEDAKVLKRRRLSRRKVKKDKPCVAAPASVPQELS